jgi:hypothetical protein
VQGSNINKKSLFNKQASFVDFAEEPCASFQNIAALCSGRFVFLAVERSRDLLAPTL